MRGALDIIMERLCVYPRWVERIENDGRIMLQNHHKNDQISTERRCNTHFLQLGMRMEIALMENQIPSFVRGGMLEECGKTCSF